MPIEFPPTTVFGRGPFSTSSPLSFSGLTSTGWGHNGELAGFGPGPIDESDAEWDRIAAEGPYNIFYNPYELKSIEDYVKRISSYPPSLYTAFVLDMAVNKQRPLAALGITSDLLVDWSKASLPQSKWYTLKNVTQNAFFQSKALGLAMAHDFMLWGEEATVDHAQYRVQEVFDNGGRDILVDNGITINPFSSGKLLFHYIYGKGEPLVMNVKDIGIKLGVQDIPALKAMVLTNQTPTTRPISIDKMGFWTGAISDDVKYTLGNISLNIEGEFKRFTDNSWKFSGTLKVWDDVYDGNLDLERPWNEQLPTAFLAALKEVGASEFDIQMRGSIPLEFSGKGDQF